MSVTGLKSQRKRRGALAAACRYVLIAFFAIAPALGGDISTKGTLETALSEIAAAMREGDFTRQVSESLPPRLAGLLAKKTGKTVEALQKHMTAGIEKRRQEAPAVSFTFDLGGSQFGTLPSGMPYALISTTTKYATSKSEKTVVKEKMIALLENGKWYLVSVSQPHTAAWFREAYPEFAQVSLPEGTTENLEK